MKDVVLMEASGNNNTTKYKKKYKCPYCEIRLERPKLVQHVQNKHADLIPEGYSALRVVFNYINKKDCGHCIICGKETAWNEEKGRYERLCGSEECRRAYEKMVMERTKKKYDTDDIRKDPRYKSEMQRRALANRKISGEYQFPDGGKVRYVGSYERKFLEFMDLVMKINSEDIISPGPDIEYQYNGQTHLYLPDFYYIPYNLIIEIKDGKDSNNTNAAYHEETDPKNKAKEQAVIDSKKFNYVKVTNNDFSQIVSMFAVLKYQLNADCYDPVIRINESASIDNIITESDIDIVANLLSRDDVSSIEDLSESELSAFYKLAGIPEDGILNEVTITENFLKDPLYVVLMDLDMMRNKAIKWFTHSKWSHAAISMDPSLDNMYSFANERDDEGNVLRTGFTRERKSTYLQINRNCKTKVFALFINSTQKSKVQKLIRYYLNNMSKSAYNMFSIISIVIHKTLKQAKSDPLNMICSQFVYTILAAANIVSNMNKDAARVTPGDIDTKVHDERLFTLFEGLLRDYKPNDIKVKVEKAYNKLTGKDKKKSVSESVESLDESYIFSKDNLYINYDDFKSGKTNICLITGLSGSGKSTEAQKVAKENNAEWIELDLFEHCYMFTTDEQLKEAGQVFYDYLSTHKDIWDKLKNKELQGAELGKEIAKFLSYCTNWCEKHKDSKWVLEGIQIYDSMDPKDIKIKKYPLVIIRASVLKSIIQRYKRTKNLSEFPKMIRWYISDEKKLKKFIEIILDESANMKESMSGTIGAALPLTPEPRPYESNEDNYYIIQRPMNNVYDYSITKDPTQYTMYSLDPEKGYRVYKSDKIDKHYITFKMKDSRKAKEVYDEISKSFNKSLGDVGSDYIYYLYTGNHIISEYQLLYDNRLELVSNFEDQIREMCEDIYTSFIPDEMSKLDSQINDIKSLVVQESVLPEDIDNLEDLESWKASWDQATQHERSIDDEESIRLYGALNIERYNTKKASLLEKEPTIESSTVVAQTDDISHELDFDNWDIKLMQARNAEASDRLIMIDTESDLKIIDYSSTNIDRIKEKWERYHSLSAEERSLCNSLASNIFGIDNENLYYKILNMYDSRTVTNTPIVNEFTIKPFFSPEELSNINIKYSDTILEDDLIEKIKKSYINTGDIDNQYVYCRLLEDLYIRLELSKDQNEINTIKQSMLEMGWNPEIPVNINALYNHNIKDTLIYL